MNDIIPLKKKVVSAELPRMFYRINDVAQMTQLSPTSIRRMIAAGDLKAKRFGRSVRIAAAEIERLKEDDSAA